MSQTYEINMTEMFIANQKMQYNSMIFQKLLLAQLGYLDDSVVTESGKTLKQITYLINPEDGLGITSTSIGSNLMVLGQ